MLPRRRGHVQSALQLLHHFRVQRVVLGGLGGQHDVGEAVLLPDCDVPVPVGTLPLPHAEAQPLVKGLGSPVVNRKGTSRFLDALTAKVTSPCVSHGREGWEEEVH